MSHASIPTTGPPFLVFEPAGPEFTAWGHASLARREIVKDWARQALETACSEAAPTFSAAEFSDGEAGARFTLEVSHSELERFLAAALAATYPGELCYQIGRRRKPTRYWGYLLLGPWAHAVLNRAAAKPAPLPSNVIPIPQITRTL